MIMPKTSVKNLILSTVQELHRASRLPLENQWFTRAVIAQQLKVSGLNPARVNALKQLVEEGLVVQRQRPKDARDYPEYSLPH